MLWCTMADDPYRDDLAAAHRRIAALERQIERRPAGTPEPLPQLVPHLDDDEAVLWQGGPDPRAVVLTSTAVGFGAAWLGMALFGVVLLLRGMPGFMGAVLGNLLWVSAAVGGFRLAGAWRRARDTKLAVTAERVLLLEPDDDGTRVKVFPRQKVHCTDLVVHRGERGTVKLAFFDDEPPLTLPQVPDAPALNRLLRPQPKQ